MCLVDRVYHCDQLVGEDGAGYLAFLLFVACVLSAMVCLLFLLVSLLVYRIYPRYSDRQA